MEYVSTSEFVYMFEMLVGCVCSKLIKMSGETQCQAKRAPFIGSNRYSNNILLNYYILVWQLEFLLTIQSLHKTMQRQGKYE